MSEDASSLLPLGDQIVRGGDVVKPVALDFKSALLLVHLVVAIKNVQDVLVDVYWVLSNDDAGLLFRWGLVVPRVTSDVLNGKSLSGIWVKNVLDHVLGIITQKLWQGEVRLQDLLV